MCPDSGKIKYWLCMCECGTERRVFGGDLKRGGSVSCGCLMREDAGRRMTLHGMSFHPAYRNWVGAKTRCENEHNQGYKDYGGRGIKLHARWATFEAFWEDMGATWVRGRSLDRIDVNGDYAPGNVRWATPLEQANNRRNNVIVDTSFGRMKIGEAAKLFGIPRASLYSRIKNKWPESDWSYPVRKNRPKVR